MNLSILCRTQASIHARLPLQLMSNLARVLAAELVIGVDVGLARDTVRNWGITRNLVPRDTTASQCQGDWVLELQDDEAASTAMVRWLWSGQYRVGHNWKFPRLYLWPDEKSVLIAPHVFPNWQIRITNHSDSGLVSLAPVAIECHGLIDKPAPTTGLIAAKGDGTLPWTPKWTRSVVA